MKYSLTLFFSLPFLLFNPASYASQKFSITQSAPIQASVLIQYNNHDNNHSALSAKPIELMHFEFTNEQKNKLIKRLFKKNKSLIQNTSQQEVQLGMNNVPVLDQGAYGSCVTFANTAAIDAVIGQGDYISQLCHLALGQYFENNAQHYPSGWFGSYGPIVLNQMSQFGIIQKSQEQEANCKDASSFTSMSPKVFKKYSQSIGEFIWQPVLTLIDSLYIGKDMASTLSEVKSSILEGDRVTIGFLLDISFPVGIAGEYRKPHDTWVMSSQIEEHLRAGKIEEGHEVIITGFDDNAQVTDNNGIVHQGILTLRNSWGTYAGDNGNYYMTYDYFLMMTIEAQRIMNLL